MDRLVAVVEALRDHCPWTAALTHGDLAEYLVEEAYEAVAEIESISPYPGDAPLTRERIVIARKWPQHYGGLNAYRDAEQDYYYGASLLAPDYDCEDRRAFVDGNVFTLAAAADAAGTRAATGRGEGARAQGRRRPDLVGRPARPGPR